MSSGHALDPGKPCLCRAPAGDACAHGCASLGQGRRRLLGQSEAAVVWQPAIPDLSLDRASNRSASGSGVPWGKWGPAARQLAAARARAVAGAAVAGRGPRRRLLAAAGGADGAAAAGTAAEPAGRSGGPVRELAQPSQARSSGRHCCGLGTRGRVCAQPQNGTLRAASLQDAIFALRASALKSSYRRACDPWAPQACIFACIAQALFVALPGQQPLDQLPHSGQDSLSGRPRIHVRPVHGTRRRMPAPRAGARGAAARLCARDDQLARHVRGGRAQLGRGRPAAPRVC
jgi:hypothetical protein